jgi:hypothetical protein
MRLSFSERFASKWIPEPNTGCWLWLGFTDPKGYGRFHTHAKIQRLAHRVSWGMAHGDVPEGMVLDHTCRTRSCVNPDHLRVVTPYQNSMENSRGVGVVHAAKTHCPSCGGSYTTLFRGPDKTKAYRRCLPCLRHRTKMAARKYRLAHGAKPNSRTRQQAI